MMSVAVKGLQCLQQGSITVVSLAAQGFLYWFLVVPQLTMKVPATDAQAVLGDGKGPLSVPPTA